MQTHEPTSSDDDPTPSTSSLEPISIGGPPGQGSASPAPTRGMRHALRALHHRDFAIFWTGAIFSNTGTWIQNLAVPFVVYQLTSSAFWVGFATFSQFIPTMLLGPLAGSVADRFDRRRILLITQSAMAVVALALWALWASGSRALAPLLALVAVQGVIQGLNIAAWQTFVNDLVPRRDLLSAISLNSLQFNAARAVGPAIAGILLATVGATAAFLANALSFTFVIVALLLVRTRPSRRTQPMSGGFIRQFGRALGYTRSQPGILLAMVIAVLVGLLGNPVQQFTVVFAADEFHVGPLGLAFLNVAIGLGAAVAFVMVGGWDSIATKATITRIALITYGAAVIAFALSPNYATGFASLMVVGGGFLALISTTNTSIQSIVADHIRGRVLACRIMAFSGSYPIGALAQGWVADQVGARTAVAGSGALLLLAGLWLIKNPMLASRLDDAHDDVTPVD